MRYDREALFQTVEEQYQDNGDYTETVVEEHTEYCSVAYTDLQTMHLVYGAIRQGSLTIHLQNYIGYDFNRIVIEGKKYVVDDEIDLRFKKVYVISEWQG